MDTPAPLLTIEELEKRLIQARLREIPNVTQAAKSLGISVRTLQRKRDAYKLLGSAKMAEP